MKRGSDACRQGPKTLSLSRFGFFYLVNHGVDPGLIDEVGGKAQPIRCHSVHSANPLLVA
jgi:hypothetical protein